MFLKEGDGSESTVGCSALGKDRDVALQGDFVPVHDLWWRVAWFGVEVNEQGISEAEASSLNTLKFFARGVGDFVIELLLSHAFAPWEEKEKTPPHVERREDHRPTRGHRRGKGVALRLS